MTNRDDNGQRELLPQVSETTIDAVMDVLEHNGVKLGRPAKAKGWTKEFLMSRLNAHGVRNYWRVESVTYANCTGYELILTIPGAFGGEIRHPFPHALMQELGDYLRERDEYNTAGACEGSLHSQALLNTALRAFIRWDKETESPSPAKEVSRLAPLKVRNPPVGPQPDHHILAQAGSRKSAGESGTIVTESGRADWEASAKLARVLLYKATDRGAVLYAKIERFDTDNTEHSMDLIVEELGRRPETRRSVLSLQRGSDDD